jgi:GNAT superfamily N-acetyltransferase
MHIRPAQQSDGKQILQLLLELGYETTEESLSLQLETYIRSSSSSLLVADKGNGYLAGLISGHLIPLIHQFGNVGRITAFVVGANSQSAGIGSALIESLEIWFKENNCLRIEVTSGDHRKIAHEFYKSKGYVTDERRFIKPNAT